MLRILVADSNARIAGQLIEHLEAQGHEVDWAKDGDHALAMAASGAYEVMLLDVHMPVHNGAEVMRRLHLLLGRSLRVVAMAADKLPARRDEMARMGVDGYLTKPINLARLDEELTRVLRKPRA